MLPLQESERIIVAAVLDDVSGDARPFGQAVVAFDVADGGEETLDLLAARTRVRGT